MTHSYCEQGPGTEISAQKVRAIEELLVHSVCSFNTLLSQHMTSLQFDFALLTWNWTPECSLDSEDAMLVWRLAPGRLWPLWLTDTELLGLDRFKFTTRLRICSYTDNTSSRSSSMSSASSLRSISLSAKSSA